MDTTADFLRRYAIENLGGFLSGSVSLVAGHPFDTVKVRLQAGHTSYAGASDCLRQTVRAEGIRALYKGMTSPLLANSAIGAVTFSTWQEAQRFLHVEEPQNAPVGKVFVAGAIAGIVQCSIATPVELLRTKLQVQHEGNLVHRGNIDCMRAVVRSEGVRGIYRGNVSMMLREAPAYGVYFSTYEATKRFLCPPLQPGQAEPMWVECVGGAVTGAATWMAVMPFDVISTRIKALPEHKAMDPQHRRIHRVAQRMWQEGGVRAFYCGLTTAVARGIALNAMVFPIYETTVRTFT